MADYTCIDDLFFSGISETRENYSSGFKMNNNLDGYILRSQPSRSAAGGVAIYTRHTLNAFKRTELRPGSDADLFMSRT